MSKAMAEMEHAALQQLMIIDGTGANMGSMFTQLEGMTYSSLDDLATSVRLKPSGVSTADKWGASMFPVLNPLILAMHISRVAGDPGAMALVEQATKSAGLPASRVQRKSLLGDFKRMTGRTMQHYLQAYERSANSYFGKYTKLLKRNGQQQPAGASLIEYLAHPLFRNDAIQQYLRGKNLPILEFDLLDEWARRRGLSVGSVSQVTASLVTGADGTRNDEGRIISAPPDGKLLNRQQQLDTYRNMLPHVAQAAADMDITGGPSGVDTEQAWDTIIALFAVASLSQSTSVLSMADAACPPIMAALKGMQMIPDLGSDAHRFNIERLNNGFVPSTPEVVDVVLQAPQLPGWQTGAAKPRTFHRPQACLALSGIGAALLSASGVMAGYDGMDYLNPEESVSGALGHDVQDVLSKAQDIWQQLRKERVDSLLDQQAQTLLIGAMTNFPSENDAGDSSEVTRLVRDVVGDDEDRVALLNVELLQRIVKKYLMTPGTRHTLETQVLPGIDAILERQRWLHGLFGFQLNARGEFVGGEQQGVLVLPKSQAEALGEEVSVIELGDTQMDEVAHYALSVGQKIQALNITLMRGTMMLSSQAAAHQEAVQEAVKRQGEVASGGEGAFMAIEAQMEALDKAREAYRAWADDSVSDLEALLAEQVDELGEPLVEVRAFPDALVSCSERPNAGADDGKKELEPETASEEAPQEGSGATDDAKTLACRLDAQEEAYRADLDALRDAHQEQVASLEARLAQSNEEAEQAKYQIQSLKSHLVQAERSGKGGTTSGIPASAVSSLIAFAEGVKPVAALEVAESMLPDRLIILDSAKESAAEAVEMSGASLLRRLLILATEGWELWMNGHPLYALNEVMPGEVALNESDTILNMPKLRQQRTFYETRGGGVATEWLMENHNWIDGQHRLYFEVDHDREAFVIGYAGRHLAISSTG